jgi:class 3 adenylate cyclase
VIGYDPRGIGLSGRDVTDFGLDARLADLAAVVDSAGPRVSLLSRGQGCFHAIAYAARNPGRIARMVLSTPLPRGRDFHLNRDRRTLSALIDTNFELYLQAIVLADLGWDDGKVIARDLARHVPRETLVAAYQATRELDVTDELAAVACPVLVINGRWQDRMPDEAVRRVAALVPDARLVELAYESPFIFHRHVAEHLGIIAPFLAEGDGPAGAVRAPDVPEGSVVILFTDIADSTALTERLGDAAFRERARDVDERVRAAIREHGGTPVEGKVLGDGVMAVFTSAARAIEAALACDGASREGDLRLHLGIHAGDVVREGDNVYGGAVNIAARVAGLAAPGEVLVSGTVRDLARTSAGVRFEDRGEQRLKGVADAVRVFAVRAGEDR